ncbi:MAG: Unknown protein [uncultured Sulfurovum sp.]|uniref:UPF0323 domain-containing protein n=1 Tax=uncultured Sulfurovum sp. TaxID=269237 RepID=A0A6S6SV28_9BACT|nr:MAG: Unknown protein [uncultured Sulfurovum sp.]
MNRHINKISNYAMVGGLSAVALVGLQGCGDAGQAPQQPQTQPAQEQSVVKEGASVTIEKQADGSYKIIDEFPSTTTRVIVKEDGAERILTQEEIDKLVAEEEAKVEAGTSKLTQDPAQVSESGGMGLAGTLMASMAAGMVGAMLMNKLMNNQNYKQNQRASHKSASSYNRSQNSFKKNAAAGKSSSSAGKKSGFFGNNKKASSSSSSRSSSFGG